MTIDVVWGCEWEEMEEGVGGQWEGLGGQAHLSWESSDMPGHGGHRENKYQPPFGPIPMTNNFGKNSGV